MSAERTVGAMLTEYRALRSEILQCLSNRLRVMSFGLATAGLVTVASLTAWERDHAQTASFLFGVIVPSTCFLVQAVWLSEVRRGRRASYYLRGLERRINSSLGSRALGWEEELRTGSEQMKLFREHYLWVVLFFTLAGSVSAGVGAHLFGKSLVEVLSWALIVAAVQAVWLIRRIWELPKYDIPDLSWPAVMAWKQPDTKPGK